MDLLGEIYTENTLTNSERLQLNKFVLRIFSETATPDEKRILQSTSADKTATYIKLFQRVMRKSETGTITDRAQFKSELAKILWTYEKEGTQANYTIPFPYFKAPRTKEALDALLQSIYPFACKFSPERIERDTFGPYKNATHKLESVETASTFYDCLVHAFLTSMTSCYRKLSKNQRRAFAYYFRRVICPRYFEISDIQFTTLYNQRATVQLEPEGFADVQTSSRLADDIKANMQLQSLTDATIKTLLIKGLETRAKMLTNEMLARYFIREKEYLEDRHIQVFVYAFTVNIVLLSNVQQKITIATYTPITPATHSIIIYNPGDGHFRAVRRTTDSKFYFENAELKDFIDEEMGRLSMYGRAKCDYMTGEIVLHNGVEKTITDITYQSNADSEGFLNCEMVQLNNEMEAGIFQGRPIQKMKHIPISQIKKKPTAGGKRTTRKQRRIFLKT